MVRHSAENQRRNESSQTRGSISVWANWRQTVSLKHRRQRHEPHGGGGTLDKKQGDQFRVFGLANRRQHAHRTHGAWKNSSSENNAPFAGGYLGLKVGA